jgi:hypothetical protein
MIDFFEALPYWHRIYWTIAIVATIIFAIMTILSFFGADSDMDIDGDGDSGPSLFSFKSLVNFALAYGWTAALLYNTIESTVILNVIALCVGIGFLLLVFGGLTLMLKLAKDGSFKIRQALGKKANVYLRIPGQKSASGKIQVSVNGSVHEIDAWTEGEELPTGAVCTVTQIIDKSNVMVEPA